MNDVIADAELVTAAREGSQSALDELVGRYLPLVYNIVGRALSRRADVDDVVQETMLNVVRGLPALRDERAFRSWLVAVTMNQIRKHRRDRPAQSRPLEEVASVADPGADFADLTLTELSLSGQRREAVEASRWLDEDDRELLSLWWLVSTGHLSRAELVDAIGLDTHHVTVRVSRMKAQLDTARMVVRALAVVPRCRELDWTTRLWDGRPNGLWRKRLARHMRECDSCAGLGKDLVPAEGLLANLALVPLPLGFTAYILARTTGHAAAASANAALPQPRSHRRVQAPKHRAGRSPGSAGHRLRSLTSLGGKPLLAAAAFTVTVTAAVGIGTLVSPGGGNSAGHQPTGLTAADDGSVTTASPTTMVTDTQPPPSPTTTPASKPTATRTKAAALPAPRHTAPQRTRAPHTAASAPQHTVNLPAADGADSAAERVLAVINQARAEQHVAPLQMSTGLDKSSMAHTQTMAAGCGLQHQCPGEPDPAERESAAGVQWGMVGENIGTGGPVPNASANISDMAVGLTKGMLAEQPPNDGHRRNILSPDFHHIGITVLRDSGGTVWMTQDFSD